MTKHLQKASDFQESELESILVEIAKLPPSHTTSWTMAVPTWLHKHAIEMFNEAKND